LSITQEADTAYGAVDRILQQAVFRQFLKFVIVGFVSTAIHWGTYYILHHHRGLHILVANAVGFCLAVTNGFFWNRHWTFNGGRHRRRAELQSVMFVLVNLVGLGISTALVALMFHLLSHWGYPERIASMVGQPVALPVITLWNFFANRHWTFAAAEPGGSV
jgi:putative flippase GtrA